MDKESLAKSKFHGEEKYNCAQAVLVAFQQEAGLTDEEIKSYSAAGGGRAEGGICGAAYAAKRILKDPELHKALDEELARSAGDTACRQIRKNGMLSCRGCVGLAARFVDEHLQPEE